MYIIQQHESFKICIIDVIIFSSFVCYSVFPYFFHSLVQFHITSETLGQRWGCFSACGASWRNLSICKRDNESAKLFLTPGTCFAENIKLYLHAHQVNCLISFIITKHLDRPFLTIPTVASLSHQNKKCFYISSLCPTR
jgi:hypothetical protein